MSLRALMHVWCVVSGRDTTLWTVGPRGVVWRCATCLHERPSALRHLKPGQLR